MKRTYAAPAWVVWLVSIAWITLMTRNPMYLLILLLIARIVNSVCGISEARVQIGFWRLAAIILFFSILFNLLMVRVGETVLFSFPQDWWLIGGEKSLEAAIFGAISGLTLVTLLAIFLAFNASVPVSDLIRLTPRAMANVGIVMLLAVTYVPETISQLQRIREAQALRGHRIHGVRDWRPIVIPLLIGGLERSMGIAEAMVSKGYGSTSNVKQPATIRLGLLIGIVMVFGGWILTFRTGSIGWIFLILGITLVVIMIYVSGRHVVHTRYRPTFWGIRDWLLVVFSMIPLILILLSISFVDNFSMFYTPYPVFLLPPFNIMIGLSLILLAAPAMLIES